MDGPLGEPAEGRDSGAGNSKVRRKSTKCGLQCNLQPTNTRKTAQYGVGDSLPGAIVHAECSTAEDFGTGRQREQGDKVSSRRDESHPLCVSAIPIFQAHRISARARECG